MSWGVEVNHSILKGRVHGRGDGCVFVCGGGGGVVTPHALIASGKFFTKNWEYLSKFEKI